MTLRIISLLVLTANVVGCTTSAPLDVDPSAQAILVRQERIVLQLREPATKRQRLRGFIVSASRGRVDALQLLIGGPPRLSAQIASQAKEMGVDAHNVLLDPSIDQNDGVSVRVEAIVYSASPPQCPSLSSPLGKDNSFDQTLGCSIRHNLAVMVNDPRNLLDNPAVRPSNGDRAATPVAKYRTFATDKDAPEPGPNNPR
ncbi:CpaD family pilus assembly lipoprotein [Rhizobium leguminosarum]|uniref:CpaD family pilus assembly lipoprotein n=1 Tax=Rhizobium leguminosarum TaxID=384 RepID=UPI001AE47DD8|nr:CpaD family pilus assembly lipoprotein [Rhizobium leguminosarum]MBP2449484.1 pilus assembly protein CpaD [Rhizobium leguminosarum]